LKYKITFIGDPKKLAAGLKQRSFGPHWKRGLNPGESVMLDHIPDSCTGNHRHQFLVDGKVYEPPAPEKSKPKPGPKLEK